MLTTPVLADSVSPYDLYDDPFEFTLTFSNNDIDLQDGDINYPATMDRISFSILSIDNEHIQWGFVAGSSYLSLDNDTALAGMNLNGYHAGFTLRGHAGTNPQLGLRGVYRYQETRNEFATQSATISWHELNIAATGKILLGQHLGLGLAWVFSDIKAQRRARGDINDTLNLRLNSAAQIQLELEWLTGGDGSVSLAWQRGAYESIGLHFSRSFK